MERKTFKMAIKSFENTENGRFSGYLSIFNNVDHGGDLVEPGAFTKTLQETPAFPLYWAHQTQNHEALIGSFYGKEDKHGLMIDAEFLPDETSQVIRQKMKILSDKKVKIGLSIGYETINAKPTEHGDETVRHLKEVRLYEGSITMFPMNDQATIQSIKEDLEQKPYPNNHACVIDESIEVLGSQTRTHEGKKYTARVGKGGDHSYLYPTDAWSEAEAKAHCKDHGGTFEAASKPKTVTVVCSACGEKVMEISDPVDDKAFDVKEPDAKSTPETEPPAEAPANRAVREFVESVRGTIKNLTN